MFKFVGLVLGYWALGFFGALLGFFIGGSIDRARELGIGGINPLTTKQRQHIFLETVFILMGKLAKADGHISQQEVNHVEDFIKKAGMTAEHRQEAIRLFKQGAQADFDMGETLDRFMENCGHTLHLRQTLLMYVTVISLADGTLDPAERNILEQIASHIGYSKPEFNHILDSVLNQANFSKHQSDPAVALGDAYKVLEVSTQSSDQEVKRAYRKLMSQHHPDKLMGQGVPEDMIKVATEKAKEIQLAYDLIKKSRATS